MKRLIYKTLQKSLRKHIDWLLSLWAWTNRHLKDLEGQENESK